jgi:rRNA biogenesis protein RRP5
LLHLPLASLQGVSGFLPKKEADAAGRALAPGSLLEVVVAAGVKPTGGSGTTAVPVVCAPEAVAGAVAREWEGLNIGSLLPGQLVTARVRNLLSDGLLCSYLTYYR